MVHATGSHAEAEDVVQEAFTQAFIKLSSFKRQSQFYTWLYRIAFNTWLSRKRRRRPNVSLDHNREQRGIEPIDSADSAERQVQRTEDVQLLQAAIGSLPDEFGQVLILREIDQRSYEEIAEIAELPIGTVRSRLHRARKLLLETMKKNHPRLFATGD